MRGEEQCGVCGVFKVDIREGGTGHLCFFCLGPKKVNTKVIPVPIILLCDVVRSRLINIYVERHELRDG